MERTFEVTKNAEGKLIAKVTVVSDATPYDVDTVINAIGAISAQIASVEQQKQQHIAAIDADIARLTNDKKFHLELLDAMKAAQ
jgi:hypothetical protein